MKQSGLPSQHSLRSVTSTLWAARDQSSKELEYPNDATAVNTTVLNHITQLSNFLPSTHQGAGTVPLNAGLDFLLPLGQTSPKYKAIHLKHLDSARLLAFHHRCHVNRDIYQTQKVPTRIGWLRLTVFCIVHAGNENNWGSCELGFHPPGRFIVLFMLQYPLKWEGCKHKRVHVILEA